MKMMIGLMVAVVAASAFAGKMTLADARAKISAAVAEPTQVATIVKQLDAADQQKFLAELNEAIGKMPGSVNSKTATYLSVNSAALKGAQGSDVSSMLATVFATVPPEALTVLNESFAADLFNRAADPSVTYTDDQYVAIAKKTVAKIAERAAQSDNSAVRTAFAILMFTRASNGSPANLLDELSSQLPEESREIAKKEWFPAALAAGEDKSYDPMLGASGAGDQPDAQIVLRMANSQELTALLIDLASDGDMAFLAAHNNSSFGVDRGSLRSNLDNGLDRLPFYYDRRVIGSGQGTHGSDRKVADGPYVARVPTEIIYGSGGKPPAGARVPTDGAPVKVVDPSGRIVVVEPGNVIPSGSTVVNEGSRIVVPPGTPIAPGGMPIGPNGKPVGPGGQTIEPSGYNGQF